MPHLGHCQNVVLLVLTLTAMTAAAYLLPPEKVIQYSRDPWKGSEPFRVNARHTLIRQGQQPLQTTAEIDFGTGGNFRIADRDQDGILLHVTPAGAAEYSAGQPVDPVVDLFGFRWLFMPVVAPPAKRLQELRDQGFLLPDNAVMMVVDRMLRRGLKADRRRLTACEDRKDPCYVIGSELPSRPGDPPRSELWANSVTFRPVRWVEVRGSVVIDTRLEYAGKDFAGLPYPAVVTIRAPGIEHRFETVDLARNPKFAPDHFEPRPPAKGEKPGNGKKSGDSSSANDKAPICNEKSAETGPTDSCPLP
ncbi:MAG: hypothetical protein KIT79_07960 [Deltaproteobacteria bacterium]|nr:hypothetical protein [Deltaproteobacteria bacterium]